MEYFHSFLQQTSRDYSSSDDEEYDDPKAKVKDKAKAKVKANVIDLTGCTVKGYIPFMDSYNNSIGTAAATRFIQNIKTLNNGKPLHINLKTVGGSVSATKTICQAMNTYRKKHNTTITVQVIDYALSAGTLIVLCADEIIMDDYALVGDIGSSVCGYDSGILGQLAEQVPINNILSPIILYYATYTKELYKQIEYIKNNYVLEKNRIALDKLSEPPVHEYTFNAEDLRAMGVVEIKSK